MPARESRRTRFLFLCTRNSARSQMAEALLVHEGLGRFEVASAGATPAVEVDPMTFEVLDELGVDWRAHRPKSYEAVQNVEWDIVITVCDQARELCPVLPGKPVFLHWPVEDPVEATGPPTVRRQAFMATARRIHASVRRFAAAGTTTR